MRMTDREWARRRVAARAAVAALSVLMLAGAVRAAEDHRPLGIARDAVDGRGAREPAGQPDARVPVPMREFTDAQGRACRVYARRVMIDGGPQTAWATVCREASGRWVLSR